MKSKMKRKRIAVLMCIVMLAAGFFSIPGQSAKAGSSGKSYVHNFTTQGTTSQYYSFTGQKNLSTSKGTITYDGLTLTKCLKMESKTEFSFTPGISGVFTMVFNPNTGSVNAKVNGTKVSGNTSTGVLTVSVSANTTYTIKKENTANLYYMFIASESGADPTVTPGVTKTPTPVVTKAPTPTPTPVVSSGDLYVSPNGSSSNAGTYSKPLNFESALTKIKAGKTIYMLPGTYSFSKSILITSNGSSSARKTVRNYNNGTVILDFSGQSLSTSNRGIILDGDYWTFYGIFIKGAGDNGMLLSGNNNRIEMCKFYENRDTGLQLSRYDTSADSMSMWPSNNLILNCTSYNNCDSSGENADGFAAKLTCGQGNVFDGCMAYNNSDDGWDLYAKSETGPIGVVTIRNCVAFRNGKLTNGLGSSGGDMNGFKLGGSGVATAHVIINCMAFENGAHGFTDNNNPSAISFKNITSFNNSAYTSGKANFQINRAKNPVVYNAIGISTSNKGSDKITGAIGASIIYQTSGKYYAYKGSTGSSFDTSNKAGTAITPSASSIFTSISAPGTSTDFHTAWRNSDGSINTHGFLQIKSGSTYATFATDGGAVGARF